MSSRDVIENVLRNGASTPVQPSVLIDGSAELWNWVLTAPVEDVTPLHLANAVLTLTSADICDELTEAVTGMIDLGTTRTGAFGALPCVSEGDLDATLARLVWVLTNVAWDSTPGAGNLLLVVACAFLAAGDHDTAVHCWRASQRLPSDDAFDRHVLQYLTPDRVAPLVPDQDDDELYDDEPYDDEPYDGEHVSHNDPWGSDAATDEPFDTAAWDRRLIDNPDITEPIRVRPPLIDRDNPHGGHR